jgi:beta-carotene 15,15'-dioxygenase
MAAAGFTGGSTPWRGPAAFTGVAALLATAGPLPAGVQAGILAFAVILSLPHGASDIVLADRLLHERLGKSWLPVFVFAYVAAASVMLLVWHLWPAGALGLFLLLSLFHFGGTDLAGREVPPPRLAWMVAIGGAPIIVPAFAYPAQIESLFALLAGTGGHALAGALHWPVAIIWGGTVLASVFWPGSGPSRLPLTAWLLAVTAVFVLLPPLLAFALYFGVLHNIRAVRDLSRTTRVPWVDLIRRSAWPSIAALAALSAGWWIMHRQLGGSDAAIRAAFVGLSAFTVPHMMLAGLGSVPDWAMERIRKRKMGDPLTPPLGQIFVTTCGKPATGRPDSVSAGERSPTAPVRICNSQESIHGRCAGLGVRKEPVGGRTGHIPEAGR